MSNNQQTPSNVGTSLILIVVAIVVGTVWYVWQARNNTDKTLNDTKKAQSVTKESQDQYKGWKSYTWASQKVTFKYPGDWFVSENEGQGRLYVKNSQVDLATQETPENFQQVWLSADASEASLARETAIKAGSSVYREVSGAVTASTIKAGNVTINLYAYNTVGGPTVEAYWTNKAGTRLYATTSTEVGQKNQEDMVANLKKVLASITLQ